MPILRQYHGLKLRHQRIDLRDDRIALRHGQSATGAEIILHIDDDQGVMGWTHEP